MAHDPRTVPKGASIGEGATAMREADTGDVAIERDSGSALADLSSEPQNN